MIRVAVGGTPLGFSGVVLIAQPWSGGIGQLDTAEILRMVAGSLGVGCSFVYARKFVRPLGLSPLAPTTRATLGWLSA